MKFERLGNIIDIRKGRKPQLAKTPNKDSVRLLQIDDLRNDENIKYTNDKTGVLASEDDILIAWDGANAGTVGFGKSGYVGSTIALLRKKSHSEFDTEFIAKFLQYQFPYLRRKASGATIPHINRSSLEDLMIPAIPLSEQVRVAKTLSKAESLLLRRKETLALLDAFLKSTFLEMFGDPVRNEKGWKKVRLSEICSKIGSGATPRGGKESYKSEGIKLIRSMNVHNNTFIFDGLVFIDEAQASKLDHVIVKPNDVLLNITGASVGRCCLAPKEVVPARVNQHVSIIRPDSNVINPVFLSRVLTNTHFQAQIVKEAKLKGATREAITKEEIERMEVPLPNKRFQSLFATIVEKTELLKARQQHSLKELSTLYGSLSQRAFQGELDLREEPLANAAEPEVVYHKARK
jgi:restriction endonuclease S subunit